MPRDGMHWWHVQLGTYGAWLPGDERGFRSRNHRLHSSGDYRNPPSADEHKGLRRFHRKRHPHPVRIPPEWRLRVAESLAGTLVAGGFGVLVVSVSATHAHLLAELPAELPAYRRAIGAAKVAASRALTSILPGRVWARGDRHDLVHDRAYQRNVLRYIRSRQEPGAAVWCFDGRHRAAR